MAQTVLINFGDLYGYDHKDLPTVVTDGTDPLGIGMIGQNFIWSCLDFKADSPDFATHTYNVSQDPSVLVAGIWGSTIVDPADRLVILNAVKNIFFNHQSAILADTTGAGYNDTPGTAFQLANWYIIETYVEGIWDTVLDQTAIDNILAWNGGSTTMMKASENPLLTAYIESSLIAAPIGTEVYFLSQSSDSTYQDVIFFLIPEPSSIILTSAFGVAGLLWTQRRRVARAS